MRTHARRALHRVRPGHLIVLAATAAGLAWSWRTWPDPAIDFGRELYVPWRLSEGDALYRDIVSFNGPFSPYLLAGWFELAGASLLSVIVLNSLVLAGTLVLVYVLFSRIADAGAATLCCLTFVGVFAFGHLAPAGMVPMGNFNWIAPYSHELTHGITLSLLSLYCVFRFARNEGLVWISVAGLALGLVFLTKAEVFAAGFVATTGAVFATLRLARASLSAGLRVLGVFAGCLALPAFVSTVLLATSMPLGDAFLGTLGTWPHLTETAHTGLPYFQWGMGIDQPGTNLVTMVLWTALYAALLGSAVLVALEQRLSRRARLLVCLGSGGLLAIAWLGLGWIGWFDAKALLQWHEIARPWPLLLLAVGAGLAWPVLRGTPAPGEASVGILRLGVVAFSLLLLGKMILNVRVFHYGFALAAPAACVVVALCYSWLPSWIERRGGDASLPRQVFVSVWLVTLVAHMTHADANMRTKDHLVGSGADAFRAGARGEIVSEALAFLREHARATDTMAAVPEGIMLNHQTRMTNPTPFLQYTPPLIALYGEQRMVESLAASPPDWILLVHRDDSDYGTRFFGRDYGARLHGWIAGHYTVVAQAGERPFRGERFGILVMKRRM